MSDRSVAIFTIAHNERGFLPVWARYYASFGNTYVLDHESTDGSLEGLPVTGVFPVRNPYVWDHEWIYDTVRTFQALLLSSHDVVVFTTPDEILAHEERSLGDYLAAFSRPYAFARTGYHVTEMTYCSEESLRDLEEPIDWERPLLGQRRWWIPDTTYGKPLVARVPLQWTCGFHGAANVVEERDPALYLIHLHRIDFEAALARHKRMLDKPLHPSIGGDFGPTLEGEPYRRWFYDLIENYKLPVERITEAARGLV